MIINIIHPMILLVLPLILLFFIWTGIKYLKFKRGRKITIIVLRALCAILLIFSLTGMNIKWFTKDSTTIFVADLSDSMNVNQKAMQNFIRNAEKTKGEKDNAGVLTFGNNTLVEDFISKQTTFSTFSTKPDSNYTNIESALAYATSLFNDATKKRIVLMTDGEENNGNVQRVAELLKDKNIELKVRKWQKKQSLDSAVSNISIPEKLSPGEKFDVAVTVISNHNTNATITLFNGGATVSDQRVKLNKGKNQFVFRDTANGAGFKNYRVLLTADGDSESRNNEASAFTNVISKPKVLVLQDNSGESDQIVNILKASKMDFDFLNASQAPITLPKLASYKSVILCNVSAENLPDKFLKNLKFYVKDLGGGVIATGGENSFALGGYFKTPLEEVLPVNMELKGKRKMPDMSLVLVIDKSGSMTDGNNGITKLDIAKEGAIRSLDSLRDRDRIGVIAFDGAVYWVVNTEKIKNRENIKYDIGTIRSGGGTSIIPALEEAYNSIKKQNTKLKHIILLTDGMAENSGYKSIVKKMQEDKISCSTVAVGAGADTQLLSWIAKGTAGRSYFTDDYSSIPRIFAKETFLATKAYINNRVFTPSISNNHQIIRGVFGSGIPKLYGYIGATPKSTSTVILKSDKGEPILSVWRYGLGKTVAWNSDVSGRWNSNYTSWDNNTALWQNIINWSINKDSSKNSYIETETNGNRGTITLVDKASVDENNKGNQSMNVKSSAKAVIITPKLKRKEIELFPIGDGKFKGEFTINDQGTYMINASEKLGNKINNIIDTGMSVAYSPEYSLEKKEDILKGLINKVGGKMIHKYGDVFRNDDKEAKGKVSLTPFFLITALLIFLIDIAFRRLNISVQKYIIRLSNLKIFSKLACFKNLKIISDKKFKKETVSAKKEKTGAELKTSNKEKLVDSGKTKLKEDKGEQEEKATVLDTGTLLNKKRKRDL